MSVRPLSIEEFNLLRNDLLFSSFDIDENCLSIIFTNNQKRKFIFYPKSFKYEKILMVGYELIKDYELLKLKGEK